jgi:II/X family phage/plasmid replication protein
MIDWLSVEVADTVGLPVNAGHVMSVDQDGQLEWSSPKRLNVGGSWSSNMTFRSVCASAADESLHPAQWQLGRSAKRQSGLEVSGNPAKFLQGHNLFGSDDVQQLLGATIAKAAPAVWPELGAVPELDLGNAIISRIDLTGSWILERETDVLPYLQAMEESAWCPYRGRGVMDRGGSTLYFGRTDKGKRAKDWALKLYWKGREVTAHPLPQPAYVVPGLLDDLNRTIRVELTLRTPELKRLGLQKVGQWTAATVREIWEAYVAKLEFGEATVNLDAQSLKQFGLKPRQATALAAWKSGTDLREVMVPSSFRRLRAELKAATGYDIATLCPKSNVVPLRRIVVAREAGRPAWADALTEALTKVA